MHDRRDAVYWTGKVFLKDSKWQNSPKEVSLFFGIEHLVE